MNRRGFLGALVALPATQIPLPAQAALGWRPVSEYANLPATDQFGTRGVVHDLRWSPASIYNPGDIIEFMLDGRRHTLRVHR